MSTLNRLAAVKDCRGEPLQLVQRAALKTGRHYEVKLQKIRNLTALRNRAWASAQALCQTALRLNVRNGFGLVGHRFTRALSGRQVRTSRHGGLGQRSCAQDAARADLQPAKGREPECQRMAKWQWHPRKGPRGRGHCIHLQAFGDIQFKWLHGSYHHADKSLTVTFLSNYALIHPMCSS